MDATSLSIKLNNAQTIECNTSSGSYWDYNQVDETTKKISPHISKDGAVCFSKDGTWYSSDGKFKNTPDEVISGFRICEASTDSPICKSKTDGSPDPEHENVYEISWSRFGNIIYEKWKAPKEGCASCEGEWILQ